MCRIMGISLGAHPEKLDVAEISAILFPELVRQGPHAYGWMSYNEKSGDITHRKFVGRSDTDKAWTNIIYGIDPKAKWVVGHTRFATHGDPADLRNDHPIPHGKIIGVHNGVLSNHSEILEVTGREDPKTQVDSEAIFAAVNKWGPSKGLRRIRGDMVAVYANRTKANVIHVARTHGRQLTIGFTKRGNIIFASDHSALLKLQPDIEFDHFTTISENRLLLIRDGKIIQRFTFRKPVVAPKRYVPPPARIVIPTVRSEAPTRSIEPTRRLTRSEYRALLTERGEMDLVAAFDRGAERAQKRGEILFPSGQPKKNPTGRREIVSRGKKRSTPNQNQKAAPQELRYFEGQLMTEKEYREAIASKD